MARSFTGIPVIKYPGQFNPAQALQLCGPDKQPPRSISAFIDWNLAQAINNVNTVVSNLAVLYTMPPVFCDQLGVVKSIYIDNTGSQQPVYCMATDTGFVITASARDAAWYPVITNNFEFLFVCEGMNAASLPTTKIFFANRQIGPYSDEEIQQAVQLRYSSLTIGGGAAVASIAVQTAGFLMASGAISITGGGGSGATAGANLDVFGRFTNVVVSAGGSGYKAPPICTPTGGFQSTPGAWNDTTVYTTNQLVTFGGTVWAANQTNPNTSKGQWAVSTTYQPGDTVFIASSVNYGGINGNDHAYTCIATSTGNFPSINPGKWTDDGSYQPGGGGLSSWTNSGQSTPTLPRLAASLGQASNVIQSAGFGVPALGDQVLDVSLSPQTVGNTVQLPQLGPYPAPMFAILTGWCIRAIHNQQATGAQVGFQLEGATTGKVALWFYSEPGTSTAVGSFTEDVLVESISGFNLILDATDTYQIRLTNINFGAVSSQAALVFRFFYTLNPRV